MSQVEIFCEGQQILRQVTELLDQKKSEEGFSLVIRNIQQLQNVIIELAKGEFLLPEQIRQVSGYLLQALENKDEVLLYDVVKYALLDVLNQLLGQGCEDK